jgi:WD40 repeat protein
MIIPGHGTGFNAALSPDGKTALAGTYEGPVLLFDAMSGQVLRVLEGHENRSVGAAYSRDGKSAFTAGLDGTVRRWDLTTGGESYRLTEHTDTGAVLVSDDGTILLTGGADDTLAMWDAHAGVLLRTYPEVGFPVSITRDGKRVLSFPGLVGLRIWDTSTGQDLRRITQLPDGFGTALLTPDGKSLVLNDTSGHIFMWHADYHDTLRYLCSRLPRDFSDAERKQFEINDASPTCLQQ